MYLKALVITTLLLNIKYGESAPVDRNEDREDFVIETSDEIYDLVDHDTKDTIGAISNEKSIFANK